MHVWEMYTEETVKSGGGATGHRVCRASSQYGGRFVRCRSTTTQEGTPVEVERDV